MATTDRKNFSKILLIIFICIILMLILIGILSKLGWIPWFHRVALLEGLAAIPFMLILLIPIFGLIIVVWVYYDAKRHGMNGILWALLVLVGHLAAFIIYLIVRNGQFPVIAAGSATQPCPSCGNMVAQTHSYCPQCGAQVRPFCPNCQKTIANNWSVCPYCGQKLKNSQEPAQ
ncbi:MAG: zinc ribbon domain-containing protein [candidate division KSB1 bacterium]|nr:zinc ribbon domain-containing protein [candidate division KSB1 bacterium]MDZ7358718.1 zinc ribbon domain-containing protein [candidate division KSB1 bacterium]MDZ7377357.1 zinc ribbon domain-containing protein [candidate division KSB1 bacterium]MDZ7398952.1 zinc ribbon domain-containing protein [candidate division KSB1 bacterium]